MKQITDVRNKYITSYLNKKVLKISNNTYNPKNINFVLKIIKGILKAKSK